MWPVLWLIAPIIAALIYERWPSASTDSPTGDTLGDSMNQYVQRALTAVGGAYTWGGADPLGAGADCSGLVAWVFGIAHQTAADLYASIQHVDTAALQAGDLLFYDFNGTGIDHVAIYNGDGTVTAAADPLDGIIRQPIYYSGLVGAGRVK